MSTVRNTIATNATTPFSVRLALAASVETAQTLLRVTNAEIDPASLVNTNAVVGVHFVVRVWTPLSFAKNATNLLAPCANLYAANVKPSHAQNTSKSTNALTVTSRYAETVKDSFASAAVTTTGSLHSFRANK